MIEIYNWGNLTNWPDNNKLCVINNLVVYGWGRAVLPVGIVINNEIIFIKSKVEQNIPYDRIAFIRENLEKFGWKLSENNVHEFLFAAAF